MKRIKEIDIQIQKFWIMKTTPTFANKIIISMKTKLVLVRVKL